MFVKVWIFWSRTVVYNNINLQIVVQSFHFALLQILKYLHDMQIRYELGLALV